MLIALQDLAVRVRILKAILTGTSDALLHRVCSVVVFKLNLSLFLLDQIDIFGCLQSHLITMI